VLLLDRVIVQRNPNLHPCALVQFCHDTDGSSRPAWHVPWCCAESTATRPACWRPAGCRSCESCLTFLAGAMVRRWSDATSPW